MQKLWCDYLEREFLLCEFKKMVEAGAISGLTSNPAIFRNALKSAIYQKEKEKLKSLPSKARYESLAFEDIKTATQTLLPLWKKNQSEGLTSIEIDPFLCDDPIKSIDEAKRIWRTVDQPNLMIKIPATLAAPEIITALYPMGINLNLTLVFSQQQTQMVLDTLKLLKKEKSVPQVVISIFVSRFDRLLELKNKTQDPAPQIGIANATQCYQKIEAAKLPNTRALFASTGVKDDFIPPTYYVKNLAFENTINTVPLETLKMYLQEKGEMIQPSPNAEEILKNLAVDEMAQELLKDGLESFTQSFEALLREV